MDGIPHHEFSHLGSGFLHPDLPYPRTEKSKYIRKNKLYTECRYICTEKDLSAHGHLGVFLYSLNVTLLNMDL
jgi:hypothetical protein